MAPEHPTRRLAVILFADIAGYTALMQQNEQDALGVLTRFKQCFEEKTTAFQGNIIQYYGDACLVVFDSPVSAVACARALQEAFRSDPRVPVRMGMHLGDVVFREGNVFGDAVNIASRIESMGVPGAVLLSQAVRAQIRNQPEFQLTSLGNFDFKNVEEQVEVFALANAGFPVPKREEMMGKLKAEQTGSSTKTINWRKWTAIASILMLALLGGYLLIKNAGTPAPSEPDRSIAVLPFQNLSADEDNRFFCDGVMEAVLNHLSRIEGLTVIERGSVERYANAPQNVPAIAKELGVASILQGSVQRQGNQVRISARLVSGKNGAQLWSGMFDRKLNDIFNIQSEIAESIANRLKIELSPKAKAIFAHVPTSDITAHDYYLRGRENLAKFYQDRKNLYYRNALINFKKALELDASMAPAYSDIASTFLLTGYLDKPPDRLLLDSVRILSEKALSLDPNLPQAHWALGMYYYETSNFEKFEEEQLKALDINKNYALACSTLGSYYASPAIGKYEKGIELLSRAIQVDPFSVWTSGYYDGMAATFLHINAFEEAEYYANKVREMGSFSGWNGLVHAYMVQGKYKQAEELAKEWYAKSPMGLRYLSEIEVNFHKNYRKALGMYEELGNHFPDLINFRQREGLAYWLNGQKDIGRKLFMEALKEYDTNVGKTNNYCYDKVGIQATLGNIETALAILRDKNCGMLPYGLDHYCKIDPLFQNLWDNPEFQKIIEERLAEKEAIRERVRQATKGVLL